MGPTGISTGPVELRKAIVCKKEKDGRLCVCWPETCVRWTENCFHVNPEPETTEGNSYHTIHKNSTFPVISAASPSSGCISPSSGCSSPSCLTPKSKAVVREEQRKRIQRRKGDTISSSSSSNLSSRLQRKQWVDTERFPMYKNRPSEQQWEDAYKRRRKVNDSS